MIIIGRSKFVMHLQHQDRAGSLVMCLLLYLAILVLCLPFRCFISAM